MQDEALETPVSSVASNEGDAAETPSDDTVKDTPKPRKRRTTAKTSTATPKVAATRRKKTAPVLKFDPEAADQPVEIPGFSDNPEGSPESSAPEPAKKRRVVQRKKKSETVTAPEETDSQNMAELPPIHEKPVRKRKTATKHPIKTGPVDSVIADLPEAQSSVLPTDTETPAETASFYELGLSRPILEAIEEIGYTTPTPIQYQAIPEVLAGHDVLGVAQTGTGKTASFTLPLLEKLSNSRARARMPRSLILEPTRELALQVADNFKLYGKNLRLNHALLIGGNSMNEQRDLLNRGVDVLIATPGRLLDLFDRGGLLLMQTDLLVIDEADRMLDMGFIPDIERIVSLLPRSRQTLFFSATMAPEIRRLADAFLTTPKEITVARQSSVASTITERLCLVEKSDKKRALKKALENREVENAIIFCNRKRDVDELQAYLSRNRFSVGHLHGDLTQQLRFSTLERFRSGEVKILVCSDVAARGIDIDGLSHVFNYDLPFNAEDYVHRIGRTGRAGKEGHALSFATPDERALLEAIERLTGKVIEYTTLEGIHTAEWLDEKAPVTGKNKRNTRKETPEKKSTERNASSPNTEEKKPARRPNQRTLLPPMPESDVAQQGFGAAMPAFMNVEFSLDPHLLANNDNE